MSARQGSLARAAVALATAATIAIAPIVPIAPTVARLTTQAATATRLLAAEEMLTFPIAAPASSASPALTASPAASPFAIGGNIIPIYNAIQPWVAYAVELAVYAVGWIPVVGTFAQQISIGYAFIQPIVQAVVYNFAYLLQGSVGLGQAIANVVTATLNSFGTLIANEINWVLSFLPPLPPLPFGLLAKPVTAKTAVKQTAAQLSGTRTTRLTPNLQTGDTQPAKTNAPGSLPKPAIEIGTARAALPKAFSAPTGTKTKTGSADKTAHATLRTK
jgi:hypothetical protein